MTELSTEEQISILEGTKDALHTRGWGKGTLFLNDGSVCLLGALSVAMGMEREDYCAGTADSANRWREHLNKRVPIFNALSLVVQSRQQGRAPGLDERGPGGWNDYVARDVSDVIDVIDEAEILIKERA